MDANAIQAALAQGQQQQVPVDAGACGLGAGYPFGGGFASGCSAPGLLNPGVTPTFPGYVPPGVVASFKTLGACGVLGHDGKIYEVVEDSTSTFLASGALVDINGVAVDTSVVGFIPTINLIGTDGEVRLVVDDGFATVCGWKWTATDRILVKRAAAQKDFVDKVLQTPADSFNIDGCACPIAFTCITEDDALELDLALICAEGDGVTAPFIAIITGDPDQPNPAPVGDSGAYGIDASPFAFVLYLNVYETVGTCGVVAPLYNLAPNATPVLPGPPAPGVACPPGMLGAGMPAGGYPNGMNGYMQPGQQQ